MARQAIPFSRLYTVTMTMTWFRFVWLLLLQLLLLFTTNTVPLVQAQQNLDSLDVITYADADNVTQLEGYRALPNGALGAVPAVIVLPYVFVVLLVFICTL
jgi:hypothetical protein